METSLSRPKRREDWVLEPFDDTFVLYDPCAQRVLEFSSTAALIWQLCDGTRTNEEITKLLADAYPEDAVQVERDVAVTLAKFVETGSVTS